MPLLSPAASRYRPAILVVAGAATAYATWRLCTSTGRSPGDGLHRSNAVRRRPRTQEQSARTAEQLLTEAAPLGEFDFFGRSLTLEAGNVMSHGALLELGRGLQPHASDEAIEERINSFYELYVDRLLGALAQGRPLSELPVADLEAIVGLMNQQLSWQGTYDALQRLRSRATLFDVHGQPVDSIAPTEAGDWEEEDVVGDVEGQMLQRTLYHIAEDRARHEGVVHRGITCNGCDVRPIRGIRWHCANCADFDLCSDCEATNTHIKTHIFYKIRIPAPNLSITKQEPLYPGRPHMMSPSIDSKLKRRLVKETRMEAEEVEALWDQFTCLATTPWTTDPNNLGWALDRRAFNQAFIPRYSSFKSAPNLIYDRVFSYFDSDHNTLIGFEEFVKGIDSLHTTDTHVKLRIVFNGYDVDGDGYISRKDVLRVFRAHYAIEREATRNYLAESAEEMSVRGALETIQSAQPLGSAFTQAAIEPGEPNWLLRSKPSDDEVDAAPIAENRPDTLGRDVVIATTHPVRDDEDGDRVVTEAVRNRWARRHFYTDEEEGFAQPEGADDGPSPTLFDEGSDGHHEAKTIGTDEDDENDPSTPESERPRWSRSSSRVRFQDDVDVETRSNASTSSRPVGERWGGYEIPEPEKDLGKEVLYQITQQAFNELLDPLFKEGEDATMDAFASRDERRRHVSAVDAIIEKFDEERDLLKRIVSVGAFTYANCVVKAFSSQDFSFLSADPPLSQKGLADIVHDLLRTAETSILPLTEPWDEGWQPEESKLWIMMLYRVQLGHELAQAMEELAVRRGWLSPALPPTPVKENKNENDDRDPTLPQFRPNSLADVVRPPTTTSNTESNPPTRTEFAPLFVVPSRPETSNSTDDRPATEVGTAPYTLNEYGITLSRPIPLPDPLPHPMMHILSFDSANKLVDETRLLSQHPAFDPNAPQQDGTFHRAIMSAAYEPGNTNLHLRLVALARLETVDRRDAERKGGGKVSFGEFERAAREGRMRFLESWMDWVSF